MLSGLLSGLLSVLAGSQGARAAGPAVQIQEVYIVSAVGDAAVADASPKRALRRDGVRLYAVLQARQGRRTRLFSAAPKIRIRGRVVVPEPLERAPAHALSWWRIEPTSDNLSNTRSGRFRFEPIDYQATPIWDGLGKASIGADVRPTLTPDRGGGLGTMRYQVRVAIAGGDALRSPGVHSRAGRSAGGLSRAVHRVSLRLDDSYVGYLTELYGQPYIWASAGVTDRRHQSERLEGADCADFVTYGWRRAGHAVPYTWTGGLRKHTRRLSGPGTRDDQGVYRDRRGRALPFPEVGDLVLFPRHVGVMIEDRGAPGILDDRDRMFHTLFKSPEIEAIRATSYAATQVEVLRWRGRNTD